MASKKKKTFGDVVKSLPLLGPLVKRAQGEMWFKVTGPIPQKARADANRYVDNVIADQRGVPLQDALTHIYHVAGAVREQLAEAQSFIQSNESEVNATLNWLSTADNQVPSIFRRYSGVAKGWGVKTSDFNKAIKAIDAEIASLPSDLRKATSEVAYFQTELIDVEANWKNAWKSRSRPYIHEKEAEYTQVSKDLEAAKKRLRALQVRQANIQRYRAQLIEVQNNVVPKARHIANAEADVEEYSAKDRRYQAILSGEDKTWRNPQGGNPPDPGPGQGSKPGFTQRVWNRFRGFGKPPGSSNHSEPLESQPASAGLGGTASAGVSLGFGFGGLGGFGLGGFGLFGMGYGGLVGGAIVGRLFSGAYSAQRDFTDLLNRFGAVSGLTGADLADVGEILRQLSVETGIATSQFFDGYVQLKNLGVKVANIVPALKVLGIAAVATDKPVKELVQPVGQAVTALGLEGKSPAETQDNIASAMGAILNVTQTHQLTLPTVLAQIPELAAQLQAKNLPGGLPGLDIILNAMIKAKEAGVQPSAFLGSDALDGGQRQPAAAVFGKNVLDQQFVKGLSQTDRTMDRLIEAGGALAATFGGVLEPGIRIAARPLTALIEFTTWLIKHMPLTSFIAAAMAAKFFILGPIITAARTAMTAFGKGVKGLMSASPWGIALTVATVVFDLVVNNIDEVKATLIKIGKFFHIDTLMGEDWQVPEPTQKPDEIDDIESVDDLEGPTDLPDAPLIDQPKEEGKEKKPEFSIVGFNKLNLPSAPEPGAAPPPAIDRRLHVIVTFKKTPRGLRSYVSATDPDIRVETVTEMAPLHPHASHKE